MLIVMHFEVGLLFSAVLGLGLGTFLLHNFVKMPQLPAGYSFSEGKRGDYMPNPDPCCGPATIADPHKEEVKPKTTQPTTN